MNTLVVHIQFMYSYLVLRSGTKPWLAWLSWFSIMLETKRLRVWFPIRAHAQVVGSIPGSGEYKKQPIDVSHIDVSLPLLLPPFPLSKKIKIFKKKWDKYLTLNFLDAKAKKEMWTLLCPCEKTSCSKSQGKFLHWFSSKARCGETVEMSTISLH